ncbi:MAG: response regulator [Anaerolineae bacterium]|nr:response regulator [Anaerolineae bacterium]
MADFEGVQALIIEDDQTSINVLTRLLDQLSVGAAVIQDTAQAEISLREVARPDVIFLDLEMPALNGYNVLQLIQKDEFFNDVPVVAYTTHISHMNDARRAGFNGFLGKPLDKNQFPDQLARILNGESVWEVP